MKLNLRAGDCWCSHDDSIVGRSINVVQKFWSKDRHSYYTHSGIMIGQETLFEAMWKVQKKNFYKAYNQRNVIIGRHKEMTPEKFIVGWQMVNDHEGRWYAAHRLIFFLIPYLARKINYLGLTVCSELATKFFYSAGLMNEWSGWNPDDIADMIHTNEKWDIIFEGKLGGDK